MRLKILDPQNIGRNLLRLLGYLLGYRRYLCHSLKNISLLNIAPVRAVFFKQIYFTGIEAFGMVSLIATLIGFVIITQVANIVGSGSELMGKILIWTVVREMGPLFSAIVIIARSGTAVASELGSMKVGREVESLRVMGIDPMGYLIVPRITGIIVSVFVLTFYFQIMAVAGGLVLSSMFSTISFSENIKSILSTLSMFEIGVSLLKSLVFGLVISTVVCYQGFGVRRSITEIPQAATRAVMQSLFLVIIFDGIITFISFL
ncbi:MAG: ABC transporter permease [Thermodesulfovibrionales bacterium]|nr:ABC transporter permease [Thermodesulfovibrionales bacterium]